MSLLVPPGPDQKLSKDLLKDRSFAFPLGIRATFSSSTFQNDYFANFNSHIRK